MPTNEERHDVAARLRVLASHKAADEELVLDALGLYRGNNIEGFDTHCVMELADIIEPVERTCRMEYDNSKRGVYCSHCGERMDVYTWEHHVDGTAGYLYPFCYWCGAKVINV